MSDPKRLVPALSPSNEAMKLKIAESQEEKKQLNELLWQVLWKPLNLPRDVRNEFALPGSAIELIAVDNRTVAGGLVAKQTNQDEIEIRHLAVSEEYQHKSVGTNLLSYLVKLIKTENTVRIRAYVRNTSYSFFTKHGFTPVDEQWIDHADFMKHEIRFKLVEKRV